MPVAFEQIETVRRAFADDGRIPNNPRLPLVVYKAVLGRDERNTAVAQALLQQNGWRGTWVNGVFPFHHYHSNAHEALLVTGGRALLVLGGEDGMETEVEAGDALVLPAGTGHCRIEADGGFEVVGGYPPGQEDYDLLRGASGDRPAALRRIAEVPLPETDPLYGAGGPLLGLWGGQASSRPA